MGIMNRSGMWAVLAVVLAVGLVPMLTSAADPDPLQDFCVADNTSTIVVNGFPCKPTAWATDFASAVLVKPGDTKNYLKSKVTPAFVGQFAGLNTLGLGAARIDFAKGGLNPPHTHPRASELLLVVKGELYVGFVSTNGLNNTLYATTVKQGELFIFPRGLVHFQLNVGKSNALAFGFLNSQNPNAQQVAASLFESVSDDEVPISDEVLEIAFQISQSEVDKIRQKLKM